MSVNQDTWRSLNLDAGTTIWSFCLIRQILQLKYTNNFI